MVKHPRLTVILLTYNHEKSFEKAIKSVLSQKTNFGFKIHIIDDGSVDDSQSIMLDYEKRFPDTVKCYIADENLGVGESVARALETVDTQYYAMLETDDYWCNENKLQIQVDILDKNPDCSFCGHNTLLRKNNGESYPIFSNGQFIIREKYSFPNQFIPKEFVKVHPSSRVVRSSCTNIEETRLKDLEMYDSCHYWYLLSKGKMYYIDEVMSVYNYTGEGAFSGIPAAQRQRIALLNLFAINKFFDFRHNNIFSVLILNYRKFLQLSPAEIAICKDKPELFYHLKDDLLQRLQIKLLYSDYKNNFGDMLSYRIIDFFHSSSITKCQNVQLADAVGIGSLLDLFLEEKDKKRKRPEETLTIAGSGFIAPEGFYPEKETFLMRKVRVLGVRGRTTQKRLESILGKDLTGVCLGDPGLLASECVDVSGVKKRYKVGLIPHYIDEDAPCLKNFQVSDFLRIDIKDPIDQVMTNIAQCEFIFSSAMHGLIAADSLGIPNRRIIMSDEIVGGDYKYNDYYSVFAQPAAKAIDLREEVVRDEDLGRLHCEYTISQDEVDAIKKNLTAMIKSI